MSCMRRGTAVRALLGAVGPWIMGWALAVPARGVDEVEKPPASPLTPTEAQALFRLGPGLRIELVASEPTISSPVEIAFDESRRLWVVEMLDYPNGPAPGAAPEGRIKVLDDLDGDGQYERVTTFAEGLSFANGLLPWKGGVIVTTAPEIVYLKDEDGDGRADRREALFRGFTEGNPQLRVSHPTLGIDGWVYVANGLRGGTVTPAKRPDAAPIEVGGMDFRFNPRGDGAEAISGMGQYGLTFDAWGNRFVCDNRHHLRQIAFPNRYARRNPSLAVPDVVEDISVLGDGPLSSGGKIYPISRNWTTSSLHAGRFTAACGIHVYGGTGLPVSLWGVVFTCDPTGNLVHGERMGPNGATFRARPLREGVEFLASTDTWFRPVNLTTGPDGAFYVVDMYRAVIEHPEFMPEELKRRPDLLLGKERGRIWRIVPTDQPRRTDLPDLAMASRSELLSHLGDRNSWTRITAQRLLLERLDPETITALKAASPLWESPLAQVHRLGLLDAAGALDEALLLGCLGPRSDARVREHVARLSEGFLGRAPRLVEAVKGLADDPDAKVRFQAALSLGVLDRDEVLAPLARIALAGSEDRWARLAVESAVAGRAGKLLAELFGAGLTEQASAGRLALVSELCGLVGAREDDAEVRAALASLMDRTGDDAARWQLVGLDGLAGGLARGRRGLGGWLAALGKSERPEDRALERAIHGLSERSARQAFDANAPVADRTAAIKLLSFIAWGEVGPRLTTLLGESPEQAVRIAAARAIAAHDEPDAVTALMGPWRSATPAVRREIVGLLLRRADRFAYLLDRLEAGDVLPGDLDAIHVRQMTSSGNTELRDRARRLLQASLPRERKEVLERYRPALTLSGDARRGREVFTRQCATCHRVAAVGVDVGPDIGDTRTKSKEMLLGDILNPNQAIDGNYVGYVVALKDGAVLDGVIAAETATSLTLKRAEGKTEILLRKDIDELRSSGQSLMPEGLEKNVSVEEMADLLTFLKDWRYLEGDVPAGISGH